MAFPLHSAIVARDVDLCQRLIGEGADVNQVDSRGYTPLHLAVYSNHTVIVRLLLATNKCNPTKKTPYGWTALQDACYLNYANIVKDVYSYAQQEVFRVYEARVPELCSRLSSVRDFYLEIAWEFSSAVVPTAVVDYFTPSDTYRIWKRGSLARIDSTLAHLDRYNHVRGNMSYIFRGLNAGGKPGQMITINHTSREWFDLHEYIRHQGQVQDIDAEVVKLCSLETIQGDIDATRLTCTQKVGWFGSPYTLQVGKYDTVQYDVDNIKYRYLKRPPCNGRPEHIPLLSTYRADQRAPAAAASAGTPTEDNYTATVWMTERFPCLLSDLMPLIEILVQTNSHFSRLKEVLTSLPTHHFPVQVSMPVFPGLYAVVRFAEFFYCSPESNFFSVPTNYTQREIPLNNPSPQPAPSPAAPAPSASAPTPAP
eukprot:gnl/Spiro4/29540_TR14466_c0_g1_i1.p1 gnl/Spiro4/29540_TR14466_c0_g1~~gnl/Spiro4/29540_TR14466_c0_g1_i1.p1  ORF type:complete len:436 (-),score=102.94 gnl/Spiro4/29540_TR14466_c0_g1_i1:110-1384(-)